MTVGDKHILHRPFTLAFHIASMRAGRSHSSCRSFERSLSEAVRAPAVGLSRRRRLLHRLQKHFSIERTIDRRGSRCRRYRSRVLIHIFEFRRIRLSEFILLVQVRRLRRRQLLFQLQVCRRHRFGRESQGLSVLLPEQFVHIGCLEWRIRWK